MWRMKTSEVRPRIGDFLVEAASVHQISAAMSTKSLRRFLAWFTFTVAMAVVFFLGIMQYVEAEPVSENPRTGPALRQEGLVGTPKWTHRASSSSRGQLKLEPRFVSFRNGHSEEKSSDNPSILSKTEEEMKKATDRNRSQNIQITRSIRNHTIHSICQAEQITDMSMLNAGARESLTRQIIVDDDRKFLYCYVPKVACSNWKRVIKFMQGTIEDIGAKFKMDHKNGLVFLDSFSEEEIEHRIKTYYKFMFVRNPVERLLSAFRNKFGEEAINVYKERYAPGIIHRYRGIRGGNSKNITLEEFIRFLLDTRAAKMDQHWRPMHLLCQPCVVQYDFVGSFEQLNEDADYVLDKIKGKTGAYFPPRQGWYNPTTEDKVEALISSVDPVYVQRFVDKYILDFITFGYAPPKQYYLKYNHEDEENTSENDIDPRGSEDS